MGSWQKDADFPALSLIEPSAVENILENYTRSAADGQPPPWLSRWRRRQLQCLARMNGSRAASEGGGGGGGGGDGDAGARCPVSWDQVHCWPPSPAGALAVAPCIDELNGVYYDTTLLGGPNVWRCFLGVVATKQWSLPACYAPSSRGAETIAASSGDVSSGGHAAVKG